MPELPDVEVFRQYLESTSLHQDIDGVEVPGSTLVQGTSVSHLTDVLRGNRFVNARRHGKYLFGGLQDGQLLVLHFGMTGFLRYFRGEERSTGHERLIIHFSNGYHLVYDCQRKLGEVSLARDLQAFIDEKELGPDPLDPDFDLETFRNVMRGSRAAVKSALMDQKRLAGIGNIYSDEILFQAGIPPWIKANALTDWAWETLYTEMTQNVLPAAIEARADPSRFPDSFIIPHRHGDGTCPLCGGPLEKSRIGGRSAFYCPHDQQEP